MFEPISGRFSVDFMFILGWVRVVIWFMISGRFEGAMFGRFHDNFRSDFRITLGDMLGRFWGDSERFWNSFGPIWNDFRAMLG